MKLLSNKKGKIRIIRETGGRMLSTSESQTLIFCLSKMKKGLSFEVAFTDLLLKLFPQSDCSTGWRVALSLPQTFPEVPFQMQFCAVTLEQPSLTPSAEGHSWWLRTTQDASHSSNPSSQNKSLKNIPGSESLQTVLSNISQRLKRGSLCTSEEGPSPPPHLKHIENINQLSP